MRKVLGSLRRPSPAAIMAVIALFVALGGTAIAGGVLTTKQFKKQAMRGPLNYVSATADLPQLTTGAGGLKVSAHCPGGTRVIGGGAKVANGDFGFANDSYPTSSGWTASFYDYTTFGTQVTVTAICATVKKVSGAPPAP